jgi:primosomal protein N'
MKAAFRAGGMLRGHIEAQGADILVLGPTEAMIFKVSGRYRYHISLSCADTRLAGRIVSAVIKAFRDDKAFSGFSIAADLKPNEM